MNVTLPFRHCLRLACAALVALTAGPAHAGYAVERAFPGLSFTYPTDIQPANDGTNRMFVVEKGGFIWVFENDHDVTTKQLFLGIDWKTRTAGEAGLLGLAFDPNYKHNGYFFIFYITKFPSHTIVSRYHVSAPDVVDYDSEVVLIDVEQPTVYHNGGQLAFGKDDMLYVAMGDNRVSSTAQDLTDLPGSILRLNVHVDPVPLVTFGTPPYQIPTDNPFVNNNSGYRPEIYAYGFRNPWRFSIDRYTDELWVCDVGEDNYEEIDIIAPGDNGGWPLMEGSECFPPGTCDTTGLDLKLPLYSYSHSEGSAIVGGCRYWGSRLPELAGVFLFADYTSSVIWGLHYDGAGTPERFDLATNVPSMLTVGVGIDGEPLMGSLDGQLYRLARIATGARDSPLPTRFVANFPNPFNPSTTIRFLLGRPAVVRLDIVSVTGERVRQFDLSRRDTGTHEVMWRGETASGTRVGSGVYFCRLVVDGVAVDAMRMVLAQ